MRRPSLRQFVGLTGALLLAAIVVGVLWLVERTANVSLIAIGS